MTDSVSNSTIGLLDLQGGVVEHLDHFDRLGIRAVRVKQPAQLAGLAGLVIPGGESTCLFKLMTIFNLDEAIRERCREGMKVWGTCAGAILVATNVAREGGKLGLIDMDVERNAFGSQLDSFAAVARVPAVAEGDLPLTFIRAPKITRVGSDVQVLLRQDGYVAMAESAQVLVTVFHPELTPCLAFHAYFARKCGLVPRPDEQSAALWSATSWTRHAPI
jgi:5'-phosphate synthase pdxT subunit